jgi:DnaJ-class molecular chaperone
MTLTPEEIDEKGICPTCKGQGRYYRRVYDGEFESLEIDHCEDCGGTGYQKEDGDVD